MELERETQIKLRQMLKEKHNVERFRAARSWDTLAMELGVSAITLRASLKGTRGARKLTPEQLDYARLMRSEYDKHKEDFENYTNKAIADRLGIAKVTVRRWNERILNERY